MIRRNLIVAAAAIIVAFITACADATGPNPSHACQLNSGTGTCVEFSPR